MHLGTRVLGTTTGTIFPRVALDSAPKSLHTDTPRLETGAQSRSARNSPLIGARVSARITTTSLTMIAVLPNLPSGLRKGVAICLGLHLVLGCKDQLTELTQVTTKPPVTTSPSGSSAGNDAGPDTGDSCENKVQDPDETALDCGGVCQPCGVGLSCKKNSDCTTGLCNVVCLAKGCDNDTKDGNESDVDCGMGCVLCEDGKTCNSDADCQSKVCGDDGTCQEPTCDDRRLNGLETDVDCGPGCEPCEIGKTCSSDEHCESGACVGNVCADPGCNDGEKNGNETDKDCGGGCPACDDDLRCKVGSDCKSGICAAVTSSVNRCVEATCDDSEVNGRESDLNCGGECEPCAAGKKCFENADCTSQVCTLVKGENYSQCSEPSCEDGVRNGDETAPDCGGSCEGCDDQQPCKKDSDCKSNHCDPTSKMCVAATCDDERLNQGETDVDCGGPCDPCDVGKVCAEGTDCVSGRCDQVCEPGGAGAACTKGNQCVTGTCSANACAVGFAGDGCYVAADCALEECVNGKCPKGYTGDMCDSNNDCHSGACVAAKCGLGGTGSTCAASTDCVSSVCTDNKCAPTSIVVDTMNEATNDQQLTLKVNVRNSVSIAWNNVALLYYFTPEQRTDFVAYYYSGPDSNNRQNFKTFARQYKAGNGATDLGLWVMIWRTSPAASANIAAGDNFEFQMHDSPPSTMNDTNDYSYRAGAQTYSNNDKVVVCVRESNRWVHAQGTPESNVQGDPCAAVIDECPTNDPLICDPLQMRN